MVCLRVRYKSTHPSGLSASSSVHVCFAVYVLSKLEGSAVNAPVLLVSLRGKSLLALAALWGIMKHEDDTLLFNLSSHFHFTQHSTDLLSVCVENLCYLPV